MLSDREQYELAAKAADYELAFAEGRDPVYPVIRSVDQWVPWRPKDDDGDAFRLAVRLNLDITFTSEPDGATVSCAQSWDSLQHSGHRDEFFELLGRVGAESYAATRRAIFDAAVEIGRCGQ